MADASDSTSAHEAHGPVTAAVRAMRAGHDAEQAITDMLTEPDASRPAMSALGIGGLYSLFQAHKAASYAFTHEANTPRAEADEACGRMLDELCDRHHGAMAAIIEEMRARAPDGTWERAMRLKLLAHWHVDGEDWSAIAGLIAERLAPA